MRGSAIFGVHAVGGIIGAILTGVFVDAALGGVGLSEGVSMVAQVIIQAKGVLFTIVFTGIMTFIILKIIDVVMGLRVSEDEEDEGLDIALHDERGYIL